MDPFESVKVVLFDMDGVLVDVSGSYRRAIEETVFHFTGRTITTSTVQRYKNRGGFNDDWTLTHAIISDSGMEVSRHRVVAEFQRRYRGDSWNGFITQETPLVRTQTLELLSASRLIMGIVTGRPELEATWTRNRLGWTRYFPLLVAREKHEHRGKPDPFPLQHALGILHAAGLEMRPEQAMYVGDTVDDMEAARAANMWAVGVTPPYVETEAHRALLESRGAHVVVANPNALPTLLGLPTAH